MNAISKVLPPFVLVITLAFLSPACVLAKPVLIAKGLDVPWGMAWVGYQKLLVSQRSGRMSLINLKTGVIQSVNGVPEVWNRGQGGLFDVATLSQHQPGDWLYFSYAKPTKLGAATTLARAKLIDGNLVEHTDLLVTQSDSARRLHFGGRIALGGDFIYLSVGDRGHRPNSQDLTNHAGKILRLNLDGSTPNSNPFSGDSTVRAEIWSYGLRNPQGLCFTPDGNLWENEHGPRGGDEINLIQAGENYGWPVVSYGKEYYAPKAVGEATEKPDMKSPLKVYIPSIAPGDLLCYQNQTTSWRKSLFSSALKLRHLNQVSVNSTNQIDREQRLLEQYGYRIRALLEAPNGDVLFGTDDGNVYRLTP